MPSYTLDLKLGNNLVSIPLDMSGENFTNSVADLFYKDMMDPQGTGDPMFIFILGLSVGAFNVPDYVLGNRRWTGNLTHLSHLSAYWINVRRDISITFYGDALIPQNIDYTIKGGWNLFSYPFTESNPMGTGNYTTESDHDFPYTINKNLLRDSGHEHACLDDFIGQGQILTHPSRLASNYGLGLTVNRIEDWSGNLRIWEVGSGYYMHSNSYDNDITAKLWGAPISLLQAPIASGIDLTSTSGDHAFDFPANYGFGQPQFNMTLENGFKITHSETTATFLSVAPLNMLGYEFLPNPLWAFTEENVNLVSTDGTGKALGFFVYDKIGEDVDKPAWGCRGGVHTYWKHDITIGDDPEEPFYGLQYHFIEDAIVENSIFDPASPSDTIDISTNPSAGATYSGVESVTANNNSTTVTNVYKGTLGTFNLLDDAVNVQIKLSVTNSTNDTVYSVPSEAERKFRGFHAQGTTYDQPDQLGLNSKICPILYDPSMDDGLRYRYCRYYPSIYDTYTGFDFQDESGVPFVQTAKYYTLFFKEDTGTDHTDSELKINFKYGYPYCDPVDGYIPYLVPVSGTGMSFAIFQLHGILEALY